MTFFLLLLYRNIMRLHPCWNMEFGGTEINGLLFPLMWELCCFILVCVCVCVCPGTHCGCQWTANSDGQAWQKVSPISPAPRSVSILIAPTSAPCSTVTHYPASFVTQVNEPTMPTGYGRMSGVQSELDRIPQAPHRSQEKNQGPRKLWPL